MPEKRHLQLSAPFWEAARIAVDSLNKNKLRSFLTLLGIILATTTLISVTALIHGMNLYIANKVSNMGADGFQITRMAFVRFDPKKLMLMNKRNPQIRREEYAFISRNARLLKGLGIIATTQGRVTFEGNSDEDVKIDGITSNIPELNNIQIDLGREISENEVRRHADVALIGSDVKNKFFAGRDPLGKVVEVDGLPATVVGVAKSLGSVLGQSQDSFVMIPIDTYFKRYGVKNGMTLVAKAIDQDHLLEAEDESRMLLRVFRHLRPNDDDNFAVVSSDSFVSLWERLTAAIAATALAVVSVFMVVGGIVIMNIMLAAVTERTHEIGIRKSLGARRSDIMNQFLVEAAMLALTGGLIGVVIAWTIALIIRTTVAVPMALPVSSIVVGVGLSTMVGLFFGIYPAKEASKLDPIEALRSEQ